MKGPNKRLNREKNVSQNQSKCCQVNLTHLFFKIGSELNCFAIFGAAIRRFVSILIKARQEEFIAWRRMQPSLRAIYEVRTSIEQARSKYKHALSYTAPGKQIRHYVDLLQLEQLLR